MRGGIHRMTQTQPAQPTPRSELWLGARLISPALLGVGAWSVVTGVAMVKTALSVTQALAMTGLVFAGSAQLASLPLIAAGAPVWVVLMTAAIVNLRFVIYAAALSPHFAHLPVRWRLLLGYLSTDFGLVVFLRRRESEPGLPHREWLFLGMAATNWAVWQAGSVLGILLASQVPPSWGLDFAGTLALTALVVPLVASRPGAAGALVAAIVALQCSGWPLRLGLVAAVVAGMSAALLAERLAPQARVAQ